MGRRMVAGALADEPEPFHASGGDHDDPALLERIARDPRLPETGAEGREASPHHRWSQHRGQSAPHVERAVRPSAGVRQEGSAQRLLGGEGTGVFGAPVSDHEEFGAARANPIEKRPYAGDLLPAEQASEVTHEHQDRRTFGPELSHPHLMAIGIEDDERVEEMRHRHERGVMRPVPRGG